MGKHDWRRSARYLDLLLCHNCLVYIDRNDIKHQQVLELECCHAPKERPPLPDYVKPSKTAQVGSNTDAINRIIDYLLATKGDG